MSFKDRDIISGTLLLFFALLGYFFAYQIENLAVDRMSAAFFPNFIFSIMLLCGLILIRQGVQREEKIPFPKFNFPQLLPVIGLLVAYVLIMEYLGFIIATVIFLTCSIYLFGERRKMILAGVPIVTALAVYYLFSMAFKIILPEAAFM